MNPPVHEQLAASANRLWKCLEFALAAVLAAMFVIVLVNIIGRYFFRRGIIWADEIARLLFIWLSLFGAVIALSRGQHLSFSLLVDSLPGVAKKFSSLFINAVILFCLWVMWNGSLRMLRVTARDRTAALHLPMNVMYIPVSITAVLMALIVFRNIYRVFRPFPPEKG